MSITTTIRPNEDIVTGLISVITGPPVVTTAPHYSVVDETTLDTSDWLEPVFVDNNTPRTGADTLGMQNHTKLTEVTSVTLWAYLDPTWTLYDTGTEDYGGTATYILKILTGTTELATTTGTWTHAQRQTGWQSVTYTGNLTQAQLNDLRVYIYLAGTVFEAKDSGGGSAGTGGTGK